MGSSGLWIGAGVVLSVVSSNVQRLITEEENVYSDVWQHLCGALYGSPVE